MKFGPRNIVVICFTDSLHINILRTFDHINKITIFCLHHITFMFGAPGEIRTPTTRNLNPVPLPVGLQGHYSKLMNILKNVITSIGIQNSIATILAIPNVSFAISNACVFMLLIVLFRCMVVGNEGIEPP